MSSEFFWSIVKKYNKLMKSAIEGPNCIDPKICKGNCCSIKIDVPKVLAKEYIKRKYAMKEDFVRSNIFSFYLRFDDKTGKCFLFDPKLNGCCVHDSGIKPPQCWIYPTNFTNPKNIDIKCKKASGWKIINPENTKKAENLLKKYVFLSELEEKKESRRIINRTGNKKTKNAKKISIFLKKKLRNTAPSNLGGFQDTWDCFMILSAEGLSLQMKKFCHQHNENCSYLSNKFLECPSICDKIADVLIDFLQENIYCYVKSEGFDIEGKYPLYKLFEFFENKKS